MKWPKLNKKSARIMSGIFAALVILLIVFFATPLRGSSNVGLFSTSQATVGGEAGKLPSPAYTQ